MTPPKHAGWREILLLAASTLGCLLLLELAVRVLPSGDKMGWSMVPPVPDRVAATAGSRRGTCRIVALGDSFTEWRDTTGDSFVRVAQRALPGVEVVNLGEAGTGLSHYFGNLLRFGDALRPDVVLIGLYLGNDLVPATPPLDTDEARELALNPPPVPRASLSKRLAKNSVLLNYLFRLGKVYFTSLRSGFFEHMLEQMKARTGKDDAFVARRLAAADAALVDAARADAINGWDLAFAVFDPGYYGDLAAAAPGTQKGEEVEGGLEDLGTLVAAARRQNAKVVVVLLPPPVWVGEQYRDYFRRLGYGELGPAAGPVPVIERVKRSLADRSVPALDVLPALRAAHERIFLENDVHLNRRGQEIVGDELARFLVKEGLVTGG